MLCSITPACRNDSSEVPLSPGIAGTKQGDNLWSGRRIKAEVKSKKWEVGEKAEIIYRDAPLERLLSIYESLARQGFWNKVSGPYNVILLEFSVMLICYWILVDEIGYVSIPSLSFHKQRRLWKRKGISSKSLNTWLIYSGKSESYSTFEACPG